MVDCQSRKNSSRPAYATCCVFRCTHERHQLRRLHLARGARKLYRRTAGAGQTGDEIEVDVAARRSICTLATMKWRDAARPGPRRRRATRAATAPCTRPTSARPTKVATSIFFRAANRLQSPRFTNLIILWQRRSGRKATWPESHDRNGALSGLQLCRPSRCSNRPARPRRARHSGSIPTGRNHFPTTGSRSGRRHIRRCFR